MDPEKTGSEDLDMLGRMKEKISPFLDPLTETLYGIGIKPDHITFSAFTLGLLASVFIAGSRFEVGAVLLAVSGLLDILDGALARNSGRVTDFGGILDSVADRYVDAAIFIALGIAGINWTLVSIALLGALMVSYTRARAEKAIKRCDVGIAERGERLILIVAGLLTGYIEATLILVAALSHLTVLQRILYARKELESDHTL